MRGILMPFTSSSSSSSSQAAAFLTYNHQNYLKSPVFEPTSVLDHTRSPSPSPPNSSSTLGHAAAAGTDSHSGEPSGGGVPKKEDSWVPPDLPPIPAGLDSSSGFVSTGAGSIEKCDEWDAVLSDHTGAGNGTGTGGGGGDMQGQTFLHWIMGDVDNCTGSVQNPPSQHLLFPSTGEFSSSNTGFGLVDAPSFSLESLAGTESGTSGKIPLLQPDQLPLQPSLPLGMFFNNHDESKAPFFHPPSLLQAHHSLPNPSFFVPLPSFDHHHQQPSFLPPAPKRRHSDSPSGALVGAGGGPGDPFLRTNNQLPPFPLHPRPPLTKPKPDQETPPSLLPNQNQQLLDLLFEAARMVEAGNCTGARGILARLNQTLPSPVGTKPLVRSAFYFKESLQLALHNSHYTSPLPSSPFDVVLKLGAFKAFSESSPVVQFANFTCTQTLLEELSGASRIHIIDFDIGVGGQWASFMQELAQRHCTGSVPVFKLTVFISRTTHHPLELHLTQDSLSQFASDIGIPFEFNLLNLDSFDPVDLLSVGQDEAVAVNLPVGPTHGPSLPTLLRLVKQLNPKIVVSVDHGFDRTGGELSFAQHFFHAFQACMFLLDSIDSTGTNLEITSKIERYVIQPRVESAVLGRYRTGTERIVPSYRTLFAGTGFVPVPFSNFTETQAECILKRVQVRGFHVEKKQGSLVLYWQRGELVSVSAWRC